MSVLDLTMAGLNADQISVRLGPERTGAAAWSDSRNTRFRAQVLESVGGELEVYPGGGPVGPALWARSAAIGGEPWIIYVTAAGVGSYDGVHRTHTPAGWVAPRPSQISLTSLNGLMVLNAPPNAPVNVLRGGGAATVIPGWPANTFCNWIAGFRYYLVALGVFGPGAPLENLVMWSDAAEPGALPLSWLPAPENDAGDLSMADFAGPLLTAGILGDVLACYKFSGVFALAWVGGQSVMARRVLFPKKGALCGQAVAVTEREHIIATPGDLILTDGAQVRSLLEGRFKKYFFSRVQADRWESVRMAHDVTRGEVWCAYPLAAAGPLVEALVWSQGDDTITIRELPACRDIFYTPLVGARRAWSGQHFKWIDSGGRQWSDVSQGVDATGILCCLEVESGGAKFAQLDAGSAQSVRAVTAERVGIGVAPYATRKLFQRCRPRIEGEPGSVVSIQVGAHDEIGKPVVWDAARAFIVGTDESVPCMVAGRYGAARFSGASRWRVDGFSLEFEALGEF